MSLSRLRVVCLVVVMVAGLGGVATAAEAERPNVVVIMLDDLGFGDLGCYGGEIRTPNTDALAAGGWRFRRFYNASRCCPTRASLLTGMYPHQVGLARNGQDLSRDAATAAELLRAGGYQTAMVGKWHLSETTPIDGKGNGAEHLAWLNHQADYGRPFAKLETYPINRGFDRHYGTIWGVVDYFDPFSLVDGMEPVREVPDDFYYTDAITAKSVEWVRAMSGGEKPFFLYVAECAPHWPLHARPEDIETYRDTYRDGWHALRESRYKRQVDMKLIDPATHPLPSLMGRGPDWEALGDEGRTYQSALMSVHAAMVDRVDQGVGEIVQALKDAGEYENTAIFVLADNGASPERYLDPGFDRASETREGKPIQYTGRFTPGPETTWGYIGAYWANALNTPYRYWKAESFEGGCHTPFIVHWPAGLKAEPGSIRDETGHVIDLVPTFLDLAGVPHPAKIEGRSLAPLFRNKSVAARPALFFEHEGGRAVLTDEWKLVAPRGGKWELYHISTDATETTDLAAKEPDRVAESSRLWREWAERVGAE